MARPNWKSCHTSCERQAALSPQEADSFATVLANAGKDDFRKFGMDYIERTKPYRKQAPFFTDKMLSNYLHIGFIHLTLPNAKVIDARRHPLDTCFGCYKHIFAKEAGYSYDLEQLAQYYLGYDRIMKHWDEVLPGKVLRVQYEDNVADQEHQARRILDHCGLDWEDNVLRFYETKRAVKTMSSEQVRQPIYNKSVNIWKHYQKHLGPLIEKLQPVLAELPEHLDRPV